MKDTTELVNEWLEDNIHPITGIRMSKWDYRSNRTKGQERERNKRWNEILETGTWREINPIIIEK